MKLPIIDNMPPDVFARLADRGRKLVRENLPVGETAMNLSPEHADAMSMAMSVIRATPVVGPHQQGAVFAMAVACFEAGKKAAMDPKLCPQCHRVGKHLCEYCGIEFAGGKSVAARGELVPAEVERGDAK